MTRYVTISAAQSVESSHDDASAATSSAADAASAHETGTRPDAIGRFRFDGLARSSARSQTSLSR